MSSAKKTYQWVENHQQLDWNLIRSKFYLSIEVFRSNFLIRTIFGQRVLRAGQIIDIKKHFLSACQSEVLWYLGENNSELMLTQLIFNLHNWVLIFLASFELISPCLWFIQQYFLPNYRWKPETSLSGSMDFSQYPESDHDSRSKLKYISEDFRWAKWFNSSVGHFASDIYSTSQLKGTDGIEISMWLKKLWIAFISDWLHNNRFHFLKNYYRSELISS
jgi:hypothetical protein